MLDSSQSGVDGVGLPKTITNSFAVRLKAKDIQVQKGKYVKPKQLKKKNGKTNI